MSGPLICIATDVGLRPEWVLLLELVVLVLLYLALALGVTGRGDLAGLAGLVFAVMFEPPLQPFSP